jgi:hypothetical protein
MNKEEIITIPIGLYVLWCCECGFTDMLHIFGYKDYFGNIILKSNSSEEYIVVDVFEVLKYKLSDVDEFILFMNGFEDKQSLISSIENIDGEITDDSYITRIRFRLCDECSESTKERISRDIDEVTKGDIGSASAEQIDEALFLCKDGKYSAYSDEVLLEQIQEVSLNNLSPPATRYTFGNSGDK